MPAIRKQRRCFVIGPMRDDPDSDGRRWLQRLATNYIEPLLANLNLPYKVITPYDLKGSGLIMNDVISEIDRTDFVIAELTGHNPNVMYELSLCHALGRPCITIGEKPPFDIGGFRHVMMTPDEPLNTRLRRELTDSLQTVHDALEDDRIPENPVTLFYGAPLTGVSSTVAVAHTYFINFIRLAVERMTALNDDRTEHLYTIGFIERDAEGNQIIVDKGRALKDRAKLMLTIVVPDQLEYCSPERINELKGPEKHKLKNAVISSPHRPFTIMARLTGATSFQFIDIPTPMQGLVTTVERRMRGLEARRGSAEWRELEGEEIDRFHYALDRFIQNHQDTLRGKVRTIRFDPAILDLRREDAKAQAPDLLWLYDILTKR